MRNRGKAGQTLLLAVLIGVILIISIPIIIFLNQISAFHQVSSQKRLKARSIAQAGIAYAARQLSANLATWTAALNNNFTGTDCNGAFIPSPSGGNFKLICSTDPVANPGLQPYEVAVTAVAYMQDASSNQPVPLRAMKAYLGQRTLGTDLANDLHAGAALQLMSTPSLLTPFGVNPPLVVHWGPIVSFDTGAGASAWKLTDPLDHATDGIHDFVGYPRIFSQGGITGTWCSANCPAYPRTADTTVTSVTTDEKEYWAFASQTFPPLIDENYYQLTAEGEPGPIPAQSGCLNGGCYQKPPNSGHFVVPAGSVAIFDGTTFNVPFTNTVIYVDGGGDVEFINTALDLKDGGAFIITGSLTLGASGGGAIRTMWVPNAADLEYYYWDQASGAFWPGRARVGNTLISNDPTSPFMPAFDPTGTGYIHFRGFLYVKGNLLVLQPNNWNLIGSVLVGDMQAPPGLAGQLIINGGASMTLAYDDKINHLIHVSPIAGTAIKVVPDLLQDIPTP